MNSERMTPEDWAERRRVRNAKRKRDKAIAELRKLGMTDAEIEEQLGFRLSVVDAEVIDAEVITVDCEETKNLPARIEYVKSERIHGDREHVEYKPKPNRTADGRSTNAENIAGWNQTLENNAQKRCSAKNSYGEPCRRYAIKGGKTCPTHSGSAIQVKRKAKERLEMAADRMAIHLLGLATDAESENIQLSAVNSALDRAGLKPSTEVVLSQGSPFEEVMGDLEFGTMTRAESRAARGLEPNSAVPQENNSTAPAMNQQSDNVIGEYDGPEAQKRQGNSTAQTEAEPTNSADRHRDSGPATRQNDLSANLSDPTDIPKPAHRQGRDSQREAKCGPVITGTDAIALANAVNAATGALRAKRHLR